MWLDFEPSYAGPAGYNRESVAEFDFPTAAPQAWRKLWQDIVGQMAVATDDDAKVALLRQFSHGSGVRSLGFVNAHALNSCVTDKQFAADLLALDVLVRDGIGLKALYGLTGRAGGLNLNGTDLLPELLELFRGRRIALFGTQSTLVEGVARKLRRQLDADIVAADGFQPDRTYLDICARHRPALVVLGMGMPKQERVARLLKASAGHDLAIVCGGAIFDFLSGHVTRAPLWMRRCGLEWAHRLSIEPKRLFGRYVIGNPLFMLRSLVLALRPAARQTAPRRPRFDIPPKFETRQRLGLRAVDEALATTPPSPSPRPTLVAVPAAPPVERASPFSANRPVIVRDDLYGRESEVDWLLEIMLEQRGSALLYAPRGYGKTSLVRVFGDAADARGHVVIYASCSRGATFDSLMRGLLVDVPGLALPTTGSLTINSIAAMLAGRSGLSLVFILDEFDRLEQEETRRQVVDLIKDLSDLDVAARFLLVGVATDAEQILGFHPSVHRCITCKPLARLPDTAIRALLTQKAEAAGLMIGEDAAQAVVRVSAGSAYHAQLIGQKLAGRSRRIANGTLMLADLLPVIAEVLDDAARIDPSIAQLRAAFSDRQAAGHLVIFATTALAAHDDLIRINIVAPFAAVARREAERLVNAGILLRTAPVSGLPDAYRFGNAFVPQLIIMMQLAMELEDLPARQIDIG